MDGEAMKRIFLVGISLLITLQDSPAIAFPSSVPQIARDAAQAVADGLNDCGLLRWNAYDPRLPRPLIPAQEAVVSPSTGLLAYYNDWFGYGGEVLEWKSPNGGQNHNVSFNNEQIAFVTPYQGTVAHGNGYVTPFGVGFNFYCFSQPLANVNQFYQCIQANFVNVIVQQLCRF